MRVRFGLQAIVCQLLLLAKLEGSNFSKSLMFFHSALVLWASLGQHTSSCGKLESTHPNSTCDVKPFLNAVKAAHVNRNRVNEPHTEMDRDGEDSGLALL